MVQAPVEMDAVGAASLTSVAHTQRATRRERKGNFMRGEYGDAL